MSDLPNIHHVNSRRMVVWFRQVYQTEIRNMVTLGGIHKQVWYAAGVLGCRVHQPVWVGVGRVLR
jgi:hypothetical protein